MRDRQAYETPLLIRQLKKKIAQCISESDLMMCEIEPILNEALIAVRDAANLEYEAALRKQEKENKEEGK